MVKIQVSYFDWLKIDNAKPKVGDEIVYNRGIEKIERIDENGWLYSSGGEWLIGTPQRKYENLKKVVSITKEQLIKLKKMHTF